MSETLKGCPFCGSDDIKVWHDDGDLPAIAVCRHCGTESPKDSWNTRADESKLAALEAENATLRAEVQMKSSQIQLMGDDKEKNELLERVHTMEAENVELEKRIDELCLSMTGEVSEHEQAKADNAALKERVNELESCIRTVRDNMTKRAVFDFDYEKGEYPITGETITMLCLEKKALQARVAELEKLAGEMLAYIDGITKKVCTSGIDVEGFISKERRAGWQKIAGGKK